MKIAVISDTHGNDFEFPEADFFVHCGDLTGWGKFQEVASFARRLHQSSYKGGVIVPGNHDRVIQALPGPCRQLFEPRFKLLIDQLYVWKGLKFFGMPWVLPFQDWAFMRPESRIGDVCARMPLAVDVLVTHGPAYGILDTMPLLELNRLDGEFYTETPLGSKALLDAIKRRYIGHHVFGHIHEHGGQRVERAPGRWSYNVAACDRQNRLVRQAMVLELEPQSLEPQSLEPQPLEPKQDQETGEEQQ